MKRKKTGSNLLVSSKRGTFVRKDVMDMDEALDRIARPNPLLEAGLSRILHHFKNTPMAVITAYLDDRPDEENEPRNAQLAKELRARGYGYMPSIGTYKDPETGKVYEQPSFTIPGISFDDAMEISEKYGQKYLFWTNGRGAGGVWDVRTGERTNKRLWTKFRVFASPEEVEGGTIPGRSKTKRRGWAIVSDSVEVRPARMDVGELLGEDETDRDPAYFLTTKKKKNSGVGFHLGSHKYQEVELPLESLCLVEVDMPLRFRAMLGLPRVSVGVLGEDGFYWWIREDGSVSCANLSPETIQRWAPLYVAPH